MNDLQTGNRRQGGETLNDNISAPGGEASARLQPAYIADVLMTMKASANVYVLTRH